MDARGSDTRITTSQGLDFTSRMRSLCDEIVTRLPEFSHVDMRRVAIRYCQTRHSQPRGVQASLTPLRFENGASVAVRRGRRYTIDRLRDASGREMLYLLSFYLPRFYNWPLRDKLATVVHELWHIGPRFDGDLRRHAGRCYAHSRSRKEFDAKIEQLTDQWLASVPPVSIYDFLIDDFTTTAVRHGSIFGLRIPTPRLRLVG